jgi:hypothetical protein
MIVTSSPVMTDTVGAPGSRIIASLQIGSATATGSLDIGLGLRVSDGVDETGDGSDVWSAIVAVGVVLSSDDETVDPPHPPSVTPTTIIAITKRRDAMSIFLRNRLVRASEAL